MTAELLNGSPGFAGGQDTMIQLEKGSTQKPLHVRDKMGDTGSGVGMEDGARTALRKSLRQR